MKTRKKLQIIAVSSFAAVLVIGAILHLTLKRAENESAEAAIADGIVQDMMDLRSLAFEYVLYNKARAEKQWRIKYDHIAKHLQDENFRYSEEKVISGQVRKNYASLDMLFSSIIENRQRQKTGEKEILIAKEQETMLVNSLLITSQSIINNSFKLAKMIRETESDAHRRVHVLLIISIAIIALGSLAISLVFSRGIIKPILRLQRGAEIVGSGDLDYRIGTDAKDEIGDFSRVFDSMTARLKKMMASRDELNREIAERRKIEKERERLIVELQDALADVKKLGGMIPICAYCKKIRDDKGYWEEVASYIAMHSEASFTHGICPTCTEKEYKKLEEYKKMKKSQES